jgi:DNA-directed RNA polymerase sigma subunit (sigma70/sigma32)
MILSSKIPLQGANQSLQRYLQEVGKPELLTNNEEAELARRIKKGDRDALNKLVCANLRFVISVARHYQNQRVPVHFLCRVVDSTIHSRRSGQTVANRATSSEQNS